MLSNNSKRATAEKIILLLKETKSKTSVLMMEDISSTIIRIAKANVRGLRSKSTQIDNFVHNKETDLIITEEVQITDPKEIPSINHFI